MGTTAIPAWLLWMMWPGPQAVWRDGNRAHLLGLRGRTRSLRACNSFYGHWRGTLGGGPEGERGRAGALHGN